MTHGREDLPQAVRDQLELARRTLPPDDLVDGVMAEVRGTGQAPVWPAWLRGSLMGLGAAAALLLVAFLASGPFAANRTPSATDASAAVPSGGQLVSVEQDGFRLELWTDRTSYTAGEPISIGATLTYIGPDDSVTLYHPDPMVTFDLVELGGSRSMGGAVRDVCAPTVVNKGEPIQIPYTKSAAWTGEDPNATFYQAWIQDPLLHLPAGSWNVLVQGQFRLGDCGQPLDIGTKLTVTVTPAPDATPVTTPTPSPTPVEPELTGTKVSSARDMRIIGWSPDGAWLAAYAGSGSSTSVDVIRLFDADGNEVDSLGGTDASWVSPDVLAVLQVDPATPGIGSVILHHMSTGANEAVAGQYRQGLAGSGTGELALVVANPDKPDKVEFKLLGSETMYPGYPLVPDAWDPTGRWLAVREVNDSYGGPTRSYPLALLDVRAGELVQTPYAVGPTPVFFSADGSRMATTLVNPNGDSPREVVAVVDLADPQGAATLLAQDPPDGPSAGSALPDGRWLVGEGENEVLVWDPRNGRTVRIGRGHAAASRTGIVVFLHDGQDSPSVGLELNGAPAGVETMGIAGPAFMDPVWSPTGDRLAYLSGQDGADLSILVL
jgi:hypothetical protein